MPTYEYQCASCGLKFEQKQSMTDPPLTECPQCHGKVHRVILGGLELIAKNSDPTRMPSSSGECTLEQSGKTCCGRNKRCDKPPCE